jgi:hypothetical protein
MILVLGASWAVGEWKSPGQPADAPHIQHRGLMQYIEESGQHVVNLTANGESNLKIANRLQTWFDQHPVSKPTHIFVFQSDYTSDKNRAQPSDYDKIDNPYSLSNLWLARFYQQLSSIAQRYRCTITLIGGGVDTLWFDDMNSIYPGVEVGCQSLINLILFGNHRTQVPVFSWYTRHSEQVVKKIKEKMTQDQMPIFLTMLDHAQKREKTISDTKEYFWPDGRHPNRKGHRILYDFLQMQGYFK